MRSRQLARWLLPATIRRYLVPLTLAAVGLGIFGLLLPLIATTAQGAGSDGRGLGSVVLRTVEVETYARDRDPVPIDRTGLLKISTIPHVTDVAPWTQVDITVVASADSSSTLSFTPRIESMQPPLKSGREPRATDEILVPFSLLAQLKLKIDTTVETEHIRRTSANEGEGVRGRAQIVGTFDDAVAGVDGPGVVYGTMDAVSTLVGASLGHSKAWIESNYAYPKAYVVVDQATNVNAVVQGLDQAGFSATSLSSLLTQVPQTQRFINALRPLTGALLLLFLIVIGWSTAGAAVAARHTEVGVLRALGWGRGEVVTTFVWQFAAQGLLVGVLGGALSLLLLALIRLVVGTEIMGLTVALDADGATVARYAALVLAPVVVFLVASTVPIVRISRIPPDDVLRDLGR